MEETDMQATKNKNREVVSPLPSDGPFDPLVPSSGQASQDRQGAEEKLRAVEDALTKAVSVDSLRFLEGFRQEGGE